MSASRAIAPPERVPLSIPARLAYGVGALSDSIKTFSFTTFLLFYYTTVLGLPGSLLAVTMVVGLVWDAAIDPLIGHASDAPGRSRLGRRHTFMLVGGLLAGASFVAVFNPPVGLSTGWLFAWLLVTSLCMRSSLSLFLVPYHALGFELATDYHDRTSIAAYRAAVVLCGSIVTTIVAFMGFMPSDSAGAGAQFVRDGYASRGLAFGVVITLACLVATVSTYRAGRLREAPVRSDDAPGGIWSNLRCTVGQASFRVLAWSSGLGLMATTINAALGMHFLTYFARITTNTDSTLYFSAYYVGAALGVFMLLRASRVIEKPFIYAACTMITAVIVASEYALVGPGRPFGTGHIWPLVVFNLMLGAFGIGGAILVPSMVADIVAMDEFESGERRSGAFFGVYSFSQQMASGLAVLATGLLVDGFTGLVPARAEQTAETVSRLAIVACLVPAGVFLVAGVSMLKYPLRRARLEAIQGSGVVASALPQASRERAPAPMVVASVQQGGAIE